MLTCAVCVIELLLAFDAVPYLSNAWRAKVRTELIRSHHAQRIEDTQCIKSHPHMTPATIRFALLTLLAVQVL